MDTTRNTWRLRTQAAAGRLAVPFEELRRRAAEPQVATPTPVTPVSLEQYFELARLRCLMLDRNLALL